MTQEAGPGQAAPPCISCDQVPAPGVSFIVSVTCVTLAPSDR